MKEYNLKENILCRFLGACKEEEYVYYMYIEDEKLEVDYCRNDYDSHKGYCSLNSVLYHDVFYTYEGTNNYYYDYNFSIFANLLLIIFAIYGFFSLLFRFLKKLES